MKITIDEEQYVGPSIPPRVRKMVDFLCRLPDGKAMTTQNLADAIGLHDVRSVATFSVLSQYRHEITFGGVRRTVWANSKTIKAIREQNEKSSTD